MLFFIIVQINDFRMLVGCSKEAGAACTAWAAVLEACFIQFLPIIELGVYYCNEI